MGCLYRDWVVGSTFTATANSTTALASAGSLANTNVTYAVGTPFEAADDWYKGTDVTGGVATLIDFTGQFAKVTTKTTGTGNWNIGQTFDVPFTKARLDPGEGIAFQIHKSGTGVIIPHLGVVAELSPNLSLAGSVE